jgi:hypothetical protein
VTDVAPIVGGELERSRFRRGRLTLFGVLAWRQVSKRAMGPMVIVIGAPRIDDRLRVRDGFECVDVQALISEAAIETLDERVFDGLSRPNEVQGEAASIGPFIERLGGEFGTVIDRDGLRQRSNGRRAPRRRSARLVPRWPPSAHSRDSTDR